VRRECKINGYDHVLKLIADNGTMIMPPTPPSQPMNTTNTNRTANQTNGTVASIP